MEAPAGYGKTTAIRDYLAERRGDVLWHSFQRIQGLADTAVFGLPLRISGQNERFPELHCCFYCGAEWDLQYRLPDEGRCLSGEIRQVDRADADE